MQETHTHLYLYLSRMCFYRDFISYVSWSTFSFLPALSLCPFLLLCPLSNLQSLSQECSGGWRAGSSPPAAAGGQLGLVWAEDTKTAASRFKSSIPERISCCKGYFTSSLEPAGFCCSNSFGADLAAMEVQWAGVEVPRMGPQHTAIGLIFSLLLGNVWLSLYITSLYLLWDATAHVHRASCLSPLFSFKLEPTWACVCIVMPS